MLNQELRDEKEMPAPQGHTIGFVNTTEDRDAVIRALKRAGFPGDAIATLTGDDGTELFKRMMEGSLWGEAAEDTLKEGLAELNAGHSVVILETKDRNEAIYAADIATNHGGHGFTHFGSLADERLTK